MTTNGEAVHDEGGTGPGGTGARGAEPCDAEPKSAEVRDAVPAGPEGPRHRARRFLGRLALVAVAMGLFWLAWLAASATVPHLGYSVGATGERGWYMRGVCLPEAELSEYQREHLPPGGCDGRFDPADGESTYRYALNENPTDSAGPVQVRCGAGECHESGFRATAWWLFVLLGGLAAVPAGAFLIVWAVAEPLADRLFTPASVGVGVMLGLSCLCCLLTGRGSA
ncbi:hypothetical protein [Streptomyces sp. BE303]|uniref:hypothetical protein n=1 Tax=Streptomyces sp. BE303 TaxID=3002528 RepID=UPI002E78218C|nr:hypothetical protein [Streptomyces sp. BE303]MED7955332.1 hypothetical protein [Streptomyces sp. BE303]